MAVKGECKQFNKLKLTQRNALSQKKEAIVSQYSFSYFKGGIALEELLVQEKSPANNRLVQNA